jgi:hypothetical protein
VADVNIKKSILLMVKYFRYKDNGTRSIQEHTIKLTKKLGKKLTTAKTEDGSNQQGEKSQL